MPNNLILLVAFAEKIGKINAASLYPSGMVAIDGVAANGRPFSLTFHFADIQENENEHP